MTAWILIAVGLGLPFYSYAVYPVVLFVLAALVQTWRDLRYLARRTNRRRQWRTQPRVALVIAAHNEETVIDEKLRNALAIDYPRELLTIIVGSDGSDDRTVAIAEGYRDRGVALRAFTDRRGKLAVMNDLVAEADCDILVFSDANTYFAPDAVQKLVRHFRSARIGAVCGELRLEGGGEGAYWRYEMILKILESKLDSTLGANGGIYAIRRHLYPFPPPSLITDDFVIPMTVRARGYKVAYDPEATAREEVAPSAAQEFRRRTRIGAGNFQALFYCAGLLLPWRGFISFSFWSHKVLRWFTPFLMLLALGANMAVLGAPAGRFVLAVQLSFYLLGAAGALFARLGLRTRVLHLATYFLVINAGLACGFVRWLTGRQKAAWKRTARGAAGAAS